MLEFFVNFIFSKSRFLFLCLPKNKFFFRRRSMVNSCETLKKCETDSNFHFCVISDNLECELETIFLEKFGMMMLLCRSVYNLSSTTLGIQEFNDIIKSPEWLIYKSLTMTADG
jgi:hypothetical protein